MLNLKLVSSMNIGIHFLKKIRSAPIVIVKLISKTMNSANAVILIRTLEKLNRTIVQVVTL